MKTSKKKIEEDSNENSPAQTIDPFAVDFFGVKESPSAEIELEPKISQKNLITQKLKLGEIEGLDWYKYLATTTANEALFSNQLLELPKHLNYPVTECLTNTFSKYTKLEKKNIGFEFKAVQEVNISESLAEFNKGLSVFLSVRTEASEDNAHIIFDRQYSSELIDLVLGGTGTKNDTLRSLSSIEHAIIEFLAINVLSDLNNELNISRLSVLSVSNEVDSKNRKNLRGARITFELTLGERKGILVLLSPLELLGSLETNETSIFLRNTPAERYNKIGKIIREVETTVFLGKTSINANDLPFLENEDVILVEKQSEFWKQKVKVFVGDGLNFCLKGKLTQSDTRDILSDEIIFEVEEVLSEKEIWTQSKREKMDNKSDIENEKATEDQTGDMVADDAIDAEIQRQESYETHVEGTPKEEVDEEALASLENVMVNLRVNLGGRRMSLSEIQKIRVGQIIELGCRPNDPVEIVTENDNKPIATGELLEIEGHLGVRLTKILV